MCYLGTSGVVFYGLVDPAISNINKGAATSNALVPSKISTPNGAVGSLASRFFFVPPLSSGFFRRLTVVDFFRRLPHFIGLFSLHPLTQRKKLNGSELSILTQII